MASKATELKLRIRRLNATIDSNLRALNRGHAPFIEAINDPLFPNITVAGMLKRRRTDVQRRNMVRCMCQSLREMQAELIALERAEELSKLNRDARNVMLALETFYSVRSYLPETERVRELRASLRTMNTRIAELQAASR